MNFSSKTAIGLLLIVLGVGYFLSALQIVDFSGTISVWWPIILVIIGLIKFSNKEDSKILSGILIILGLFLLGERLNWYSVNIWSLFWPTLLVIGGASILSEQFSKAVVSKEREIDVSAFFGSVDKKIGTDGFEGGKATTVFGSIELDLRQATLLDDAALTAFSAFGSITLRVPRDCEVIITGTPIFGSVEDHTKRESGDTVSSILKLSYTALFGSVEVTN